MYFISNLTYTHYFQVKAMCRHFYSMKTKNKQTTKKKDNNAIAHNYYIREIKETVLPCRDDYWLIHPQNIRRHLLSTKKRNKLKGDTNSFIHGKLSCCGNKFYMKTVVFFSSGTKYLFESPTVLECFCCYYIRFFSLTECWCFKLPSLNYLAATLLFENDIRKKHFTCFLLCIWV